MVNERNTETNMSNTTTNNPSAHFAATDRRIVLGTSGYSHRWTFVYTPSDEAKSWDGADARTTHCIGSRFGHFPYVAIKITGRSDRWDIPGIDGPARKIRVTVGLGTIDEETVDGWLVDGGASI
jgi:hypothetical protein